MRVLSLEPALAASLRTIVDAQISAWEESPPQRSTARSAFARSRARPTLPGLPPARAKHSSASLRGTAPDLRGAKRGATRSDLNQAALPLTRSDTEEQRERNPPLVPFHRVQGRKSKEDEMSRFIIARQEVRESASSSECVLEGESR